MKILLDTHIALWAMMDSPQLPGRARMLIANPVEFVTEGYQWRQ